MVDDTSDYDCVFALLSELQLLCFVLQAGIVAPRLFGSTIIQSAGYIANHETTARCSVYHETARIFISLTVVLSFNAEVERLISRINAPMSLAFSFTKFLNR